MGSPVHLGKDDPTGVSLIAAIRVGDLDALQGLLRQHTGIAAARIVDAKGRSGTPLDDAVAFGQG